MRFRILAAVAASAIAVASSSSAFAATCTGNCGELGANGDVTAPPNGQSTYQYVTTSGGITGAGQIAGVGGTNGSQLVSSLFAANSGDELNFYFNYVTADGAGFSDYAFAELISDVGSHVAWLFTARTVPSGNTSPGTGLPANDATLTPSSTPINPNATNWAPLGGSSGGCYSSGCGNTGWISSVYSIGDAGSYAVRYGVTNIGDTAVDSGLAFAGLQVAGQAVDTGATVPEPASWAMMVGGFGMLGGALRRRRANVAFG
ncbi:NF038132 family protein [Sphingomonas bacterium]|uniref:NF038132 family protein n=1 Tax=Sphingomonas bacterium TaxID=1895847 RepID=UPI001576EBD8|nr:NF038132 family protein [Sphingomonas bacterium]